MPMPDDPNPHRVTNEQRSADSLVNEPDTVHPQQPSNTSESPTRSAGAEAAGSEASTESVSFDSSLDLGSSVFRPGEAAVFRISMAFAGFLRPISIAARMLSSQ